MKSRILSRNIRETKKSFIADIHLNIKLEGALMDWVIIALEVLGIITVFLLGLFTKKLFTIIYGEKR